MRKIELAELKMLQMDVLSAIHRFCIQHDIKYSLACGTMLGCARHKGYIPWDDDMDIYLLRDDYNKLVREFPETYNGHYKLVTLERDTRWNRAYGKAYDDRTVFKESAMGTDALGVNIDVFPIDDVPDVESEWVLYNRKRLLLQYLYEMKVISFRKGRSFVKNAFLGICKFSLFPLTSRRIAIMVQRMAKKNNGRQRKFVYECCQGLFESRSFPFKKSLFDNLKLMPFEDREFFGFEAYDEYLTNCYGDWRQLPPKEKQISHHVFFAWWK